MKTNAYIFLGINGSWNFMVFIIFGLMCTGIVNTFIKRHDEKLMLTSLVGVVGASLGGYLRTFLGIATSCYNSVFFNPIDWILSILGALIFIFVWRSFLNR